jgi:hypothetical protein
LFALFSAAGRGANGLNHLQRLPAARWLLHDRFHRGYPKSWFGTFIPSIKIFADGVLQLHDAEEGTATNTLARQLAEQRSTKLLSVHSRYGVHARQVTQVTH